jgi:hypothetical protein
MSHLSSMRTCLSNLTLLEHSLSVLEIQWYRENYSHIVIPQENGHDFGFFWNGREFEFIGDEKLWVQAWSIGTFIEKIQYQYIYKSLDIDLKFRGLYDVKVDPKEITREIDKIVIETWNSNALNLN